VDARKQVKVKLHRCALVDRFGAFLDPWPRVGRLVALARRRLSWSPPWLGVRILCLGVYGSFSLLSVQRFD